MDKVSFKNGLICGMAIPSAFLANGKQGSVTDGIKVVNVSNVITRLTPVVKSVNTKNATSALNILDVKFIDFMEVSD